MKQKDLFKTGMLFNLASHFDINHGFYSDGFGFDHVFSKWSPVNMTFNGLGNYQRMLTDATFKKLFNTFLYLLVQVPIMLFLALLFPTF